MNSAPLKGLTRIRKAAGITQTQAGDFIGVNQSHYRRFENGTVRLDIYRARVLAKALGCTIEELF